MTHWRNIWLVLLLVCGTTVVRGADDFGATPTIQAPALADVRQQALDWLDQQKPSDEVRERVKALWADDVQADVLDRLAATFALGDERAAPLVAACSQPRAEFILPDYPLLTDASAPAFERNHLRLLYGRWLSHERLYDESLQQLDGLTAADVVDPATLLFYQGVAYHRLLNKQQGIETIDRLLTEVSGAPRRYQSLAELMKVDLEKLEDDSLDHISRRMDDIKRRLDLGRAGDRVVELEDGVIASLDKMIEKMEEEQKKQNNSSGSSGGGPSNQPMPDSQLGRANGPGETNSKRIGDTPGWGELPPKEREEALQQIGKDFPAHYREAIEQYFRKLAGESNRP